MSDDLLTASEAARRLGISVTTFYAWLGQSDYGLFVIRGECVTIDYFQGGARGQGRIRMEAAEVEHIKELMRVRSNLRVPRRPPVRRETFAGIHVALGAPGNDQN